MKSQAAVLWGREQDWQILEIDLDPPRDHEVLVKWVAAGLCHSDQHLRTSDIGAPRTRRGTRSEAVPHGGRSRGRRRRRWRSAPASQPSSPVTTWPPASSRSAAAARCASPGTTNLCDLGAATFSPGQISDGTARYHFDGQAAQCHVQAGDLRRARRRPRGVAGEGGPGPPAERGGPRVVRRDHRLGLGRVPGRGRAGRHRRRGRRRRRRHERRAGRPHGRGEERRRRRSRWSSSRSRPSTSAPPMRRGRWRRRCPWSPT